jgi:hypothetical protein
MIYPQLFQALSLGERLLHQLPRRRLQLSHPRPQLTRMAI